MKLCTDVSEIERKILYRQSIKNFLNSFSSLSNDQRTFLFYSIVLDNEYDKLLPVTYEEFGIGNSEVEADKVYKEFNKKIISNFYLPYNDSVIRIAFYNDYHERFNEMVLFYKNVSHHIKIEELNFYNFEVDKATEQIKQTIVSGIAEILNKSKIFNNNISYLKKIAGIEE